MRTFRTMRIIFALAAAILVGSVADAATYPYSATEMAGGTSIVVGSCAGWGLDPDPIGASSCATTTITRTASASNTVLTNAGIANLGTTYATTMVVTRSAGSVQLTVGGTNGTPRTSSATFTQNLTAASASAVSLTFSADFEGTVLVDVTAKPIAGSAAYTPDTVTTPFDAPDAGGAMPSDAIEAVISVEANPIRYLYNANPSATVGILIPAGAVVKWGANDIAKFKAIRFIDTAAGASNVSIVYAKDRQ